MSDQPFDLVGHGTTQNSADGQDRGGNDPFGDGMLIDLLRDPTPTKEVPESEAEIVNAPRIYTVVRDAQGIESHVNLITHCSKHPNEKYRPLLTPNSKKKFCRVDYASLIPRVTTAVCLKCRELSDTGTGPVHHRVQYIGEPNRCWINKNANYRARKRRKRDGFPAYCGGIGVDPLPATQDNDKLWISFMQCRMEDTDDYFKYLFSRKSVMEKFGDGSIRTKEYVRKRVQVWVKRWEDGNEFSSYTCREARTGAFLGYFVLGDAETDEEEGSSELAGMLREDRWNEGLASYAMTEIVKRAQKLFERKCRLPNGHMFKGRIVATCRQDNEASVVLLDNGGFQEYKRGPSRHGHRLFFEKIFVNMKSGNLM